MTTHARFSLCIDLLSLFSGDISRRCSMLGVWYIPEYNCIRSSIANIQQQVYSLL